MTSPSKLLAIAIPTYNRHEILYDNLRCMLPEIIGLSVPVYISDDSTNDKTERAVKKLRAHYPNIFYVRNRPGLGHDRNFLATLRMPQEAYVWYLGDSIIIEAGTLSRVNAVLRNESPDMVFVNAEHRCADERDYAVKDIAGFLKEFAWHLTLSGATIYSRKVVDILEGVAQWRNFPQLGLILQYGLEKNCNSYWMGSAGVAANKHKKSYWGNSVVDTFARDWVNLIRQFSGHYSPKKLEQIIRSHSLHTNIFSMGGVIRHRANGAFPLKTVLKNRDELRLASQVSFYQLVIIAATPRPICRLIVAALTRLKRLRH